MPPKSNSKRRAKLIEVTNISDPTAGSNQEAKGPFQDQEITTEQPPDKLESGNRAIITESESDEEDEILPRNAVRSAADDLVNTFHLVLNREQTRRRLRADQADKKAKQTADSTGKKAGKASVAMKQAVESQAAVEKHTVRNEVVIVGTLRFMPLYEIAEETGAVSARRIFRRVKGKPEPTTAVILTFDVDPPTAVIVQHERFRTRPYVRQTVRCLNCQQFNHRQQG